MFILLLKSVFSYQENEILRLIHPFLQFPFIDSPQRLQQLGPGQAEARQPRSHLFLHVNTGIRVFLPSSAALQDRLETN